MEKQSQSERERGAAGSSSGALCTGARSPARVHRPPRPADIYLCARASAQPVAARALYHRVAARPFFPARSGFLRRRLFSPREMEKSRIFEILK